MKFQGPTSYDPTKKGVLSILCTGIVAHTWYFLTIILGAWYKLSTRIVWQRWAEVVSTTAAHCMLLLFSNIPEGSRKPRVIFDLWLVKACQETCNRQAVSQSVKYFSQGVSIRLGGLSPIPARKTPHFLCGNSYFTVFLCCCCLLRAVYQHQSTSTAQQ